MKIGFLNKNIPSNPPSFKGNPPLCINALKKLKHARCVYCGKPMLIFDEIQEFAKTANELKDRKLSKYLSLFEPYMKDNERQVLFFIRDAIEKFPNRGLKDIFQMMFPYHIKRLEAHQEQVLINISKMSGGFSSKDRELTLDFVRHGLAEIKKSKGEKHFKKNELLTAFYKLKSKFENPQNHFFIKEKIFSMPNTYTNTDAFIVKYSRKTNPEIATRLLSPSQSTIEHLIPQSEGGTNDLTNLVLACGKDNSTRKSAPLDTMPQIRINFSQFVSSAKTSLMKSYDPKSVKEYFKGIRETIDGLLTGGLHIYKN